MSYGQPQIGHKSKRANFAFYAGILVLLLSPIPYVGFIAFAPGAIVFGVGVQALYRYGARQPRAGRAKIGIACALLGFIIALNLQLNYLS